MPTIAKAFYPAKDFAYSSIKTPPNPATSGTTIVLADGTGNKFPNPNNDGTFRLIVWPSGENANSSNSEEIEVIDRQGDTLTVERGKGGTTRAISIDDQIALFYTKSKEDQFIRSLTRGYVFDRLTPSQSFSRLDSYSFATPQDKTAYYTRDRVIRINESNARIGRVLNSYYDVTEGRTVVETQFELPSGVSSVEIGTAPQGGTEIDRTGWRFMSSSGIVSAYDSSAKVGTMTVPSSVLEFLSISDYFRFAQGVNVFNCLIESIASDGLSFVFSLKEDKTPVNSAATNLVWGAAVPLGFPIVASSNYPYTMNFGVNSTAGYGWSNNSNQTRIAIPLPFIEGGIKGISYTGDFEVVANLGSQAAAKWAVTSMGLHNLAGSIATLSVAATGATGGQAVCILRTTSAASITIS